LCLESLAAGKCRCDLFLADYNYSYFVPLEVIEKFFESDMLCFMKNKPLIFTMISILCIIEPIIKILYFKAITHFDFMVIMTNLNTRDSFKDVFDFWLVYPIAGILMFKLRKWSYFAFMSLLGYIVYSIMTYEKYTWPYNSDSPFMYHYLVVIMSVMVFMAFLLPGVREPFFDRRLRWWEPKVRYKVGINCCLKNDTLIFPSEIINISVSGAFLKESSYFKIGDKLDLEFNFLGKEISLPVMVIHKHSVSGRNGYGVQFTFKSFKQNVLVARIINVLKQSSQAV
jgi:hypothetical protein